MLARTTRMETQNIAMVGKALDDGNDIVECSVIHPTCPTCASLQGRIYSISGNTPGYPSLYDTAFKNGYSIIHPNCRHQFFPYNPKFHTAEENERLQRDTRRPWDDETSDIGVKQAEKYREQYAKAQMQMRQWNKELNAYGAYRELCKQRGEEPTYKTLGAFRRAYRSKEGSLPYAKTYYVHRDAKQFEEFKAIIGEENVPKTIEKFQEMKYNTNELQTRRFDLLRLYKESVEKEKVDNIGFNKFEAVLKEANEKLVGITTPTGAKVESISYHLIERIIGCGKRLGVPIEKIAETLKNGICDNVIKVNDKGQRSVGFLGDGVFVSFNFDTNTVVQCRPMSKRKKKNG